MPVKLTLAYWLKNIEKHDDEKIEEIRQQIKGKTPTGKEFLRRFEKWKETKRAKGTPPYTEKVGWEKIKPLKGSDFTTEVLQATRTETEPFGRQHIKGQIFLKGEWRDEEEVVKWLNANVPNWSKEQIQQLQSELGYKKLTGDYTSEVKKKHLAYLKERSVIGLEAGRKQLNRNTLAYNQQATEGRYLSFGRAEYYPSGTDLNKKYSEEEARALEVDAFQNQQAEKELEQKKAVEDYLKTVWSESTGTNADKLDIEWAKKKYLQGWGYDDFNLWTRNLPATKRMYPGLPKDMSFSEYNDLRASINGEALKYLGRPLSNKELENFYKTGNFPSIEFNTGRPAIEGF